ncbi:MAG: flavodoxin-dependent (E)-4-hydroxy-3-methylbut-2-enyl-diphosphate synthase, partial [Planctomycetota bacterium]
MSAPAESAPSMFKRRPTRQIVLGDDRVGRVKVGGGLHGTTPAPIAVQTMTSGYTHDIDGCVAEIRKLSQAGADVVRVAVPERKDTEALKHILPQVNVPIVADVHFHFKRALEAVDAGVHKIRLNPGNINDRAQVIDVIQACKDKGLPIRVGVNEGSIIERRDKQKRLKELGGYFSDNKYGHLLAIFITKLEEYLDIFHDQDFHDIAISAKSI